MATEDDTVRDRMTCDPVTVIPSTPLQKLAEMMLDAHIHRVIVVDKDHRPIGIVSSTDILAAVARAVGDESTHRLSENAHVGERI